MLSDVRFRNFHYVVCRVGGDLIVLKIWPV